MPRPWPYGTLIRWLPDKSSWAWLALVVVDDADEFWAITISSNSYIGYEPPKVWHASFGPFVLQWKAINEATP